MEKSFLVFKSFLVMLCMRNVHTVVQLTLVEIHHKKESKLFSLASCMNLIKFYFKVRLLS